MSQYCKEHKVFLDKKNFLGKGLFTKAYKVGEKVILVSDDKAKECIALFCQFENKHIPRMKVLDDINDSSAYESPYYEPLKASHRQAWKDYKIVKECIDSLSYWERQPYRCFEAYKEKFEYSDLPDDLKEALETLVSSMANYTNQIFMEISPRNAKVDSLGNLILLDIIGDSNELESKLEKKYRKTRKG